MSIEKLPSGSFRVRVYFNGVTKRRTFEKKQQAVLWEAKVKADLFATEIGQTMPSKRLMDAIDEYLEKVVMAKPSPSRQDINRLKRLRLYEIAHYRLADLKPQLFADWRDARLLEVSPSSVNRELSQFSCVLSAAIKQFHWMTGVNPLSQIKFPRENAPRDRRPSEAEIAALCDVSGYSPSEPIRTARQMAVAAFLFGCDTAMRAGEIIGLTWENVRGWGTPECRAFLPKTKNGTTREVPLIDGAITILRQCRELSHTGKCFSLLSTALLDASFRTVRDMAGILDLHFHDSRREGTCRWVARMPQNPTLCRKITGHKGDQIFFSTYYAPKMAEVARELNAEEKRRAVPAEVIPAQPAPQPEAAALPAPETNKAQEFGKFMEMVAKNPEFLEAMMTALKPKIAA